MSIYIRIQLAGVAFVYVVDGEGGQAKKDKQDGVQNIPLTAHTILLSAATHIHIMSKTFLLQTLSHAFSCAYSEQIYGFCVFSPEAHTHEIHRSVLFIHINITIGYCFEPRSLSTIKSRSVPSQQARHIHKYFCCSL